LLSQRRKESSTFADIFYNMMNLPELLHNRRSVRKYTAQTIDKSLLNELLAATIRTPNTGNMQPYSIIVTTDDSIKQQLSPCHFNQPSIMNAPVVLTFCADFNRIEKWCAERKAEPGYRNFQSFFTASIDAILAAQTCSLLAESKGLGTCYFGTTTYMTAQIIDVLKLPAGVVPVLTMTLGYPAETPAQVDRLPLEAVVHYDNYKDYTPEDINRLYAAKEALPENRKFVADNSKETLAQVFTDVRYSKQNNEAFSDTFLKAIKQQEFLS
jgi:nitroreductase